MSENTIPHSVSRVFDHEKLNKAVNIPSVLEAVAPGYESYDLTEFIQNRDNVVLRVGDAFAAFVFLEKGVYEGHFLNPPHIKGKRALESCKNMLSYMFTTMKASVISGKVSCENSKARVMTRALGFVNLGKSRDALDKECVDYILEAEKWAAS